MLHQPHGVNVGSSRPVVMGRNGMVCSGHPLASQAGMQALQRGGNAVDAAVAVGAALNVVEPHMSGMGGDGFIMVYEKSTGVTKVMNCTGAAPLAATRDRYQKTGIPMRGVLSVSVPGLLDGWAQAHQKYGSLGWAGLFDSAIDLSDNGFPVTHTLANYIASEPGLQQHATSAEVFTKGGKPLVGGDILLQRNLASSFRRVAAEGPDALFQGDIGREISRFVQDQGGILDMKDLMEHRSRWQDPISTTYRSYTILEGPPNSSGHVLLQELNMMECMDLPSLGFNTAEAVHAMVEAKKLAFIDREEYVADPDFLDIPMQGLLSKEYAKERSNLIDPDRAARDVQPGNPWQHQPGVPQRAKTAVLQDVEDTTCFCVVDRWGNAVCQLQSIQSPFGSAVIAGATGILLNNRMSYWHLDPDHANCLEPGKRVRHTMNPIMVFAPGAADLFMVCGTPGADTQVQTNLQVLTHVLDFNMTVAEAVEAPRWRHLQNPTESTIPHTCSDSLELEGRFSEEVRGELSNKGHDLGILSDWGGHGSEMMIQIDQTTGALHGAADPRRDGYAVGW